MTQITDRQAPGPNEDVRAPSLAEQRSALTATTTTAEERVDLAQQLELLLEKIFVHRHQKTGLYGVDVSRRLTLLRRQAPAMSDEAFHNEMCGIVNDLRDAHTDYTGPGLRGRCMAILETLFLVERCWIPDEQRWAWLATHVETPPHATSTLTDGAEIIRWNGVPIDVAVQRNAELQPGSNAAARTAQGARSMTNRSLGNSPLPDEDWVDLDIVSDGGADHVRIPWIVLDFSMHLPPAPAPDRSPTNVPPTVLAVDEHHRRRREVTGRMLARRTPTARRSTKGDVVAEPIKTDVAHTEAWTVSTPSGTFGHLRIFNFAPAATDPASVEGVIATYEGLVALLDRMPRTGLVLDVRDNPGGLLFLAEMLLQHLTPGRIQPTPFQLAVSEETAALPADGLYGAFVPSLGQGLVTGAQYSAALPYIPTEWVNHFGQTYFGPVVLVTDALSYSATDMFAAAFQSHGIGPILGCDDTTGAGGANVETHEGLRQAWPASPLRPLPQGAQMTVAVGRALRIGPQAGQPLEDLGVEPTERHRITRRDLLEDNADLLLRAGELLASPTRVRARVDATTITVAGQVRIELTCENLDSVDVHVDGRPWASRVDATAGSATVDLGPIDLTTASLRVEGFTGPELTAARTLNPPLDFAILG